MHPQFSTTFPYIYLYYDHTSGGVNKIRVSRFEVGGTGFSDPTSTELTATRRVP